MQLTLPVQTLLPGIPLLVQQRSAESHVTARHVAIAEALQADAPYAIAIVA